MRFIPRVFCFCLVGVFILAYAQTCLSQKGFAGTYIQAAKKAFDEGRWSEAEHFYALAFKEVENINDVYIAYDLAVISLNGLGNSLMKQGRFSDAELVIRRAVQLIEEAKGENDESFTIELNNLGLVLETQGKLKEAESVHRRTLAIRERTLSPNDPNIAATLMNLGMVYFDQQKFIDAEAFFQRARQILVNVPVAQATAEGVLNLAQCDQNIAAIYIQQGKKYDDAIQRLQRAIKVRETLQGMDHPDLVPPLEDYARALRATGRVREAVLVESRAKRTKAKIS